ncbi:MAG: GNAT family N-acetyltransferase [Elainellaceae cyanobacterium]
MTDPTADQPLIQPTTSTSLSPNLSPEQSDAPSLDIQVVSYRDAEAQRHIQLVRYHVFQIEQQVSAELEFDGQDEAAIHLMAYLDQEPVGTTRIRMLGDRLAKIERVAVLSSHRGLGIGKKLMDVAIAHLQSLAIPEVKINAQTHARRFYENMGFVPQGDEFMEAGIPHIEMRLPLIDSCPDRLIH